MLISRLNGHTTVFLFLQLAVGLGRWEELQEGLLQILPEGGSQSGQSVTKGGCEDFYDTS
jgi:hypothetical protein